MVISKISVNGIKLTQGALNIAINPPADKKDITGGSFGADIILLSAPRTSFDDGENFNNDKKPAFVIDSPGEYEKDGLFIHGLSSTTKYGNQDAINTIYYFNIEGLQICVLGAHEPDTLPSSATEVIDEVDILILPIAGDVVLNSIAAAKLANKLEAKIIIPIGFKDKNDPNVVSFVKEQGHEAKYDEKIVVKANDLPAVPVTYILK